MNARPRVSLMSNTTVICREACSRWMEGLEAEASGNLEGAIERYTASLKGLGSAGEVAVPYAHSGPLAS